MVGGRWGWNRIVTWCFEIRHADDEITFWSSVEIFLPCVPLIFYSHAPDIQLLELIHTETYNSLSITCYIGIDELSKPKVRTLLFSIIPIGSKFRSCQNKYLLV